MSPKLSLRTSQHHNLERTKQVRRTLWPLFLSLGFIILAQLMGKDAYAGAVGIHCNEPVVFSNSDVNIGVIPFTTEAPDSDLTYKSNTYNSFNNNPPASKLARVIQLDTLFSLRYPAGMGVVHFQGDPEECEPNAIIERIMASHESITLKAGKGIIMYWGRFLDAGDSMYAQSYMSFLRRGVNETVEVNLGSESDALSFYTSVRRHAIPFASRRVSLQELQRINQGFIRASVIWQESTDSPKIGRLPENPKIPFAFSVSEVDDATGRMHINPYGHTEIPEGWIDARVATKSWPLRAQLPELSYLNALAGYLAFRVVEGERPKPNWAGSWPKRLLTMRDRVAKAFREYRIHAVLPIDKMDDPSKPQNTGFTVNDAPLKQLQSGSRKKDARFIIPASERVALAWSHGLVAMMDLIISGIDEFNHDQQSQAIQRAGTEINRAIAYAANDPNLLNLAAVIQLSECCKKRVLDSSAVGKEVLKAQEYWRKALSVDPGHRETIRNLSQLYSKFEGSEPNALGLTKDQVSNRINTFKSLEERTRQAYLSATNPVATIYFSSGTRINPASRSEIERVAALYREFRASNIELHGYSDPGGAADANLELSSKRVNTVLELLSRYGVPEKIIVGQGHGEVDPQGDLKNLSTQSRRRVEIYLR